MALRPIDSNQQYVIAVDLDSDVDAVVSMQGPRGRMIGRVRALHLSRDMLTESVTASGWLTNGREFNLSRPRVIAIEDGHETVKYQPSRRKRKPTEGGS
jgi:hypothetical protein